MYRKLVQKLEPNELKGAIEELKESPKFSEKERKEIKLQMDRAMHFDGVEQKIALASVIVEHGRKKYAETLLMNHSG